VKRLALMVTAVVSIHGQGLDPAALLDPPTKAWPSYNGDYSSRR
jgi:alcohol dehydrogenase (cytochrome c)